MNASGFVIVRAFWVSAVCEHVIQPIRPKGTWSLGEIENTG